MFVNLFETLKNNRSASLAFVCAIVLPIAYTNCSTQMAFEASEESRIEGLNQSGAIVINNGDEFTSAANVTLGISHASADKMYVTNDPTCETGGSWEQLSSSKPWNLDSLNRESAVYVKFSNDGAVSSDCLSDSIVHDDIPPALSIITPAPAYTNASQVAAAFSSSDQGSGVEKASCTGVGASASTDCTPSSFLSKSPVEGSHNYNVVVVDRAGNRSAPLNIEFVVDRTAPTVAINKSPSAVTNQTSSEFGFSGSDAISGIDRYECRIGAMASFASLAFQSCATTFNSAPLASGPQKFEVRSVDRAGNFSSIASHSWTIDLGAPTVTITKAPGAYSNVTRPSFEFSGTDDGGPIASYQCKIDSGAYANCSSPFMVNSALSDGPHTFSVIGHDTVGNVSAPAMYSWIVDTVAPTVTITSKPNAVTNSKSATFTMSVNDLNGYDIIECQINGGGYQNCGSTETFMNLADRNHKFDVRAKDKAGNLSNVASHSWAIDTSKPSVTIAGPGSWIKVRATQFDIAVNDTNVATGLPAPTIECKMNDGGFAPCTSPKMYSGLNEAKYTFTARAQDAAGNMSDEKSYVFSVDLTAPAINIGTQPYSLLYQGDVSEIAFQVTDSGSGVDTVRCELDSAATNCSDNFSTKILNLGVGNHSFSIAATDKAGNLSTSRIDWQISNKSREVIQTVDIKRLTKLDVLVVIDNSGSMKTEHANMASRFGTFLDQLNGVDWQVGIITTDVSGDNLKKDGRLVEFQSSSSSSSGTNQYVISSAMNAQTARTWFASTIQMATNGSGYEQGIAGSIRAIERTKNSDAISQRNAALFRSDAALAILVVTDADETNPNGSETQNKPETLINLVKNTWSGKPFSFHSIIVPIDDAVCKSKDGNESYGRTYASISNLTGGILGTVCATDYGSQLSEIGKSTQQLVSTIALQCAPLDLNNDGKADVQITTSNGSPAPSYMVQGMNLKFATELPIGTTTIRYSCAAPI